MKPMEYHLLKDFLYEAIYVLKGSTPPSFDILDTPQLQVYIHGFGKSHDDACLVVEIKGKVVGAVWKRIMNDYGHIDNQTPSLAISLYEKYRGKGIGREMMMNMLYMLQEKGYQQTSLSVQKDNRACA